MNMLLAAAKGQRLDYSYDAANQPAINAPPLEKSAVDIDGFVAGACEFFATRAKQAASVGTPYISTDGKLAPLEFTATIPLTGKARGAAYLTASRAMLTIMLMRMGATEITTDGMCKVLRELATSVANGARRSAGDDVLVWEPAAGLSRSNIRARAVAPLVVPIHWRKFTAQLALCLE